MYPAPSENVMASRNIFVIPVEVLTMHTPHLLVWGPIFALPRTDILKAVCHIVDVLPNHRIEDGIGYDYELDYVRDMLSFIYDDNRNTATIDFSDTHTLAQLRAFESDIIDVSRYLKTLLGDNLIFCRFIQLWHNRTAVMEVEHAN